VGVETPYSCKKGVCQTCILRSTNVPPPAGAQDGLKPTLRQQGYFLACACPVSCDLVLAEPSDADVFGQATVVSKRTLGADVCSVQLEPRTSLDYHAGQFVNLRRPDGLARSYSLASVPYADALLELHVRRMTNGRMSGWIFDELAVGDSIDFYGPSGSCFYVRGRESGDLLLIGTGTGLAPLYGVARDALLSGHTGLVRLFHGSATIAGLYLDRELHALAERFANFRYTPCLDGEEHTPSAARGRASDMAFAEHHKLDGWRVYLCGAPAMVTSAKKRAYLAGAALADIHADPFELMDLRKAPRGERSSR
jgi:NAD(P)H-flavin reductase